MISDAVGVGGGLQDEGVAGGHGDGVHPHRHHDGEVEGADAGDHADGLADGVDVDAGGDVEGVLALQGDVDAAGEVEGFAATLDLTDGVGVVLAVLLDDRLGQLVLVGQHQFAHLEHDGGALGEGNLGPLLLGRLGAGDGVVEVGRAGGYQFTDDLAGGGVLDGDRVGRLALVGGAVDPVGDCGHVPLPGFWGVQAGPADCFVPHRQQCRLHRVWVRPVRWPDGRNRRELCTYNNPPARYAPACRDRGRRGGPGPGGSPSRIVETCIDNRRGFS